MPYENEDVRCPVCGRYYDSARMTVDEQGRDICEVCEQAEEEMIATDEDYHGDIFPLPTDFRSRS